MRNRETRWDTSYGTHRRVEGRSRFPTSNAKSCMQCANAMSSLIRSVRVYSTLRETSRSNYTLPNTDGFSGQMCPLASSPCQKENTFLSRKFIQSRGRFTPENSGACRIDCRRFDASRTERMQICVANAGIECMKALTTNRCDIHWMGVKNF